MELDKPVTIFKVENGFIVVVEDQRWIFSNMFEVTNWLITYNKPAEESYDDIPF